MKFGSLFTGVGGFDLGLERADFECAWQVERDPHCLEVLAEHYPNVERYTDVRTVGKHNLEPVELICGGFPCQDLSVAGKRAGFAGERSSLWFEFERIIDELRPKWVIVENVPGLLSSRNGADFAIILKALDDRGYGVAWRVLDSQNFGVAQRRRRVFIVASLGNASCAEVLFESESVSGNIAKGGKAGEDIAYSLRANPSHSGDKGDGGINTTLVTTTLRGFGHGWQGQHSDTNAVLVPLVGVRRLTPTECERLQGFPDGWTAGQSDTQRYKQMGNAVTVNVIEWIGIRISNKEHKCTKKSC
jgi:DNA (cytosine-5)-methyltransferase 1